MNAEVDEVLQRWHAQVGRWRGPRDCRQVAALGFLHRPEEGSHGLVELGRLLAVVVYDDPIGRRLPALRVLGVGASVVPHGVAWGGNRFAKCYYDLRIEPGGHTRWLQMNFHNVPLLELALRLHRQLRRADRFERRSVRQVPQLPALWAGFATCDVDAIVGDGPELEALCRKFDLSPQTMLQVFRRDHLGMACFPLDWVSGHLGKALRIFAEVGEVPRGQVFRLNELPGQLVGQQGAVAYDFYHCRQREICTARLRTRRNVDVGQLLAV